jgi:hypothetical protein
LNVVVGEPDLDDAAPSCFAIRRLAHVQRSSLERGASLSGLHSARRQARDNVALSEKENQDRGQDRQRDEREHELP